MPHSSQIIPFVSNIGSFLRHGAYEPRPTNEQRTAKRRQTLSERCSALLQSLAGAGDYFDADVRSEFAREAYHAWANCTACGKERERHAQISKGKKPETKEQIKEEQPQQQQRRQQWHPQRSQ